MRSPFQLTASLQASVLEKSLAVTWVLGVNQLAFDVTALIPTPDSHVATPPEGLLPQ